MRIISGYATREGVIVLVCREGDKKYKKYLNNYKPYFCIKTKDRFKDIISKHKLVHKMEPEGIHTRVYARTPTDFFYLRNELEKINFPMYESDVPFIRQVIMDNNIDIGDESLKVLYVDIETDDSRGGISVGVHPILSIGMINREGKKKFLVSDGDEKKLLENFKNIIDDYDVLVAWNGDNFDFPYLEERFKKFSIVINWKDWQRIDLMVLYKSKRGRMLASYTLDNVGKVELNMSKLERNQKIYDMWKNNKAALMKYNIRDVEIMKQLEDKLHLIKLLEMLSYKSGLFLQDLKYPSVLVDTMIMKKTRELKLPIRFPKRNPRTDEKGFQGAFVKNFTSGGLQKNILVLDYTSFYNRIIQTWNISPETLKKFCNHTIVPETEIQFSLEAKGIIPRILETLEAERNHYKKLRNKAEQGSEEYQRNGLIQASIKVALLSFYGVLGQQVSRYYNKDMADSVTRCARWLIKNSKDYLEKNFPCEVIYIDTDSLFVKVNETNITKQISFGTAIASALNVWYKDLLKQFNIFGEQNKIEMKFEKIFSKAIIVGDEETKTKKRYCYHQIWEEGREVNSIDYKGLEIIRSDWIKISKSLQKKIIKMILDEKELLDIKNYLWTVRRKVKSGEVNVEDLIVAQSISRRIDTYKVKTPHVKVAEQLKRQGKEVWVGMKIPYVFVRIGKETIPTHPDDYKGNYDVEYYWDKKTYPPSYRILKAVYPEENWDAFLIGRKRKADRRLSEWTT